MPEIFSFKRGEPIALGDRVESGSVAGITMRGRMKRIAPGRGDTMPDSAVPVAATFTTVFTPAIGAEKAFYLHTLSPEQTMAILPGRYAFDSAVMQGADVIAVTEPSILIINNAASAGT